MKSISLSNPNIAYMSAVPRCRLSPLSKQCSQMSSEMFWENVKMPIISLHTFPALLWILVFSFKTIFWPRIFLRSELDTWCVRTDNRMVEMWRTLQHMSQPWPWPLLMRCGLWYSHYLIEHSARVTSFVLNHYLHRHVFICFTQVISNRYLYQFNFPIVPRICIKEVRWLMLTLGY